MMNLAMAPMSEGVSPMAGLLNPPVLFFFLGMIAAMVRSGLHIPKPITKLLSLYLLWAIGFQGGVKIVTNPLGIDAVLSLLLAMLLAVIVPLGWFGVLRRKLDIHNAAAVAATYGSISAVTFMTACNVLESRGITYGGHMVAAMALMESPAIVIAVLLLRMGEARASSGPSATPGPSWGKLLHEAFLNGPVLLLLGSLLIGLITGERGYQAFKPLVTDAFSGVLVFFLLDLGLLAARKLRTVRDAGWFVVVFALAAPLVNAGVALAMAYFAGLSSGDAILLMVLAASASYIAVPAAARVAIPKATPSLYVTMALGITFPMNMAVGIPLYMTVVDRLWGG